MTKFRILYTESCNRRARKFLKRHPDLAGQYAKTLQLLELNPTHPSLRLHKPTGNLSSLHSVSINISYRIVLDFLVERDTIVPIAVGSHDEVY